MESNLQISVIIPTLNRPKEALENVKSLLRAFETKLPYSLKIILSENNSDEELRIQQDSIEELIRQFSRREIQLTFIRQPSRLSLGAHMHLLSNNSSDWQLWIGDDDCVSPEFIRRSISEILTNSDLTAITCKFLNCTRSTFFELCESFILDDTNQWNKKIENNTNSNSATNCWVISKSVAHDALRGHQLSGLFIRGDVVRSCLNHMNPENLYPWITYMGFAATAGKIIHFQAVGVAVTSDTPKHFSYRMDGLQPEIVEAARSIPNLHGVTKILTICHCTASRKTVWRMENTSSNKLKQIGNYARLLTHKKIPLYAWFVGLAGLIKYLMQNSIRYRLEQRGIKV